MRPFLAFIGFVMMIPGFDMFSTGAGGSSGPAFATPAGTIFWIATGGSSDIHIVHLTGLIMLIGGIALALTGLVASARQTGPGDPAD